MEQNLDGAQRNRHVCVVCCMKTFYHISILFPRGGTSVFTLLLSLKNLPVFFSWSHDGTCFNYFLGL